MAFGRPSRRSPLSRRGSPAAQQRTMRSPAQSRAAPQQRPTPSPAQLQAIRTRSQQVGAAANPAGGASKAVYGTGTPDKARIAPMPAPMPFIPPSPPKGVPGYKAMAKGGATTKKKTTAKKAVKKK